MGLGKLSIVETMGQDHIFFKRLSTGNAAGINSGSLQNYETGGFLDLYKIHDRFQGDTAPAGIQQAPTGDTMDITDQLELL